MPHFPHPESAASIPAGSAHGGLPLVHELPPGFDVLTAIRACSRWTGLIVLESVLTRPGVGRYSFVAADPVWSHTKYRVDDGTNPFAEFQALLQGWTAPTVPGLPPFQGGIAGMLSYEVGRAFERLPARQADEFGVPDLAVGVYDWVIAWDHTQGRAWIISHGVPNQEPAAATDFAANRLKQVQTRLREHASDAIGESAWPHAVTAPLPASALATQHVLPQLAGLTSDFSRSGYLKAVERVIEYIRAGDIFQANLSQRLLIPQKRTALEYYARLRERNPATFAGYFAGADWAVASASPERFVCLREGEVETRPIKGTRRRGQSPEADLFTGDELRESEKDRAENIMIVDLLRNDLSRVCRPGSIRVPKLCAVETYETVQHLVSEIRGTLSADKSAWDLLAAVFPGGSITGAPKVRAMEIICELEQTVRGPYCGSLFYVGFDGAFDSSILIRTLICQGGWVQCPVGGGIVAQSDPGREYEETLHKAEGMLRALP